MGETLEDGTDLGQIGVTLDKIGISLLDTTGNMRNMGEVIEELMGKWDGLNTAEKQAVAVKLAGKYQYNNLLALLENADMYNEQLQASYDSLGTINEQQEIYMESLEGKTQALTSAFEGLFSTIADPDWFKPFIEDITRLVELLDSFINAIGGTENALQGLAPIALSLGKNVLSENIINSLSNRRVDAMKRENAMVNRNILRENGIGEHTTGAAEFAANLAGYDNVLPFLSDNQREAMENSRIMVANKLADLASSQEEVRSRSDSITALWTDGYGFGHDELYDKNGRFNYEKLFYISMVDPTEFELNNETKKQVKETITNARDVAGKIAAQMDASGELNISNEDMEALFKGANSYAKEFDQLLYEGDRDKARAVLEKLRVDTDKRLSDDGLENLHEYEKAREKMNQDLLDAEQALTIQRENLIEAQKQAQLRSIMSVTSAIGIMAAAWSSFQNLGSIWANEDLDFGDKLLQTIQNLGFVLPMVVGGILEMRSAMASLNDIDFGLIEKEDEIVKLKNMIDTDLSKPKTEPNAAPNTDDAAPKVQINGDNNTVATSENGPATATNTDNEDKDGPDAHLTKKDDKDKKDDKNNKKKDTRGLGRKVLDALDGAFDWVAKQLKKWLPRLLNKFTIPTLIAAALGTAIKGAVENYYKKQIEEDIESTAEKYEEAKSKADEYSSFADTVNLLMDEYRATGQASEEFKNTLKSVGESFGIQGAEAMIAVGAYEELAEAINKSAEAAREEARVAGEKAKKALERGIDNEEYLPTVVGSAITIGDKLLFWAESFVNDIGQPLLDFFTIIAEAVANIQTILAKAMFNIFNTLNNSWAFGSIIPDEWVNYWGEITVRSAQKGLNLAQKKANPDESEIQFYQDVIDDVSNVITLLPTVQTVADMVAAIPEDKLEAIDKYLGSSKNDPTALEQYRPGGTGYEAMRQDLGFSAQEMEQYVDPYILSLIDRTTPKETGATTTADQAAVSEAQSGADVIGESNHVEDDLESLNTALDSTIASLVTYNGHTSRSALEFLASQETHYLYDVANIRLREEERQDALEEINSSRIDKGFGHIQYTPNDQAEYEKALELMNGIRHTGLYQNNIKALDKDRLMDLATSLWSLPEQYLSIFEQYIDEDLRPAQRQQLISNYQQNKLDQLEKDDPFTGSAVIPIDEYLRNTGQVPMMAGIQRVHQGSVIDSIEADVIPVDLPGTIPAHSIDQTVEATKELTEVANGITEEYKQTKLEQDEFGNASRSEIRQGYDPSFDERFLYAVSEPIEELKTWMGYTQDELVAMGESAPKHLAMSGIVDWRNPQAIQKALFEQYPEYAFDASVLEANTSALEANTSATEDNSKTTTEFGDIEDAIKANTNSGNTMFEGFSKLTKEQQKAFAYAYNKTHRGDQQTPQHEYINYEDIPDIEAAVFESVTTDVANEKRAAAEAVSESANVLFGDIAKSFGFLYGRTGGHKEAREYFKDISFTFGDGQEFNGEDFFALTQEDKLLFLENIISTGSLGSFQTEWAKALGELTSDVTGAISGDYYNYIYNSALGQLSWGTGIVGGVTPVNNESTMADLPRETREILGYNYVLPEEAANMWASILGQPPSSTEGSTQPATTGEEQKEEEEPKEPKGDEDQTNAVAENTKAVYELSELLGMSADESYQGPIITDASDFNQLEEWINRTTHLYGPDSKYLEGLSGMDKIADMEQRRDFLLKLQKQISEIDINDLPEETKQIFKELKVEVENRLAQISTDIQTYVDEWTTITKDLATYDIQDAIEIKDRSSKSVDDYSIADIEAWIDELLASSENLRAFQEVTNASTEELAAFIGQVTDDADAAKLTQYYGAVENLKEKRSGQVYDENGTLLTGASHSDSQGGYDIANALDASNMSIDLKTTIASVAAENGNADAWINFITDMTEKGYSDKVIYSLMTKIDFSVGDGQEIYDQITKWETNGYLDAVQLQIEVEADLGVVNQALEELKNNGSVSGSTMIDLVNEVDTSFALLVENAYDLQEALEETQEELEEMARSAERTMNEIEGLEALERLEDGIQPIEADVLFQDIESYLEKDLTMDIELRIDNREDLDELVDDIGDLRSAVTDIGDDYQIALSDIPYYVDKYGRKFLEGMSYIDGETVQLNQEVVDAIIAGEYEKKDAAIMAQIEGLKAEKALYLAKAESYRETAKQLKQLDTEIQTGKVTSSAEANDKLTKIENKNIQNVQSANDQYATFSKESTASILDNQSVIASTTESVNATNAYNTSRSLQSMATNYNQFARGVLGIYSKISEANKASLEGSAVDASFEQVRVSGPSYDGKTATIGQAVEGSISAPTELFGEEFDPKAWGKWLESAITDAETSAWFYKNLADGIDDQIASLEAFLGAPDELPSQTGKSSGGGGGGGGTLDTKEKDESDLDRYEKVDTLLDSIESKLEKIESIQEDLTGKDKLDSIKEEIDLYKEQIPVLEEKKKIQEAELQELRESLEKIGIQFNEEGFITNYQEKYLELYEQYCAYVDAYNASTDEAARELFAELIDTTKEGMEKLNDEVSEYDDLIAKDIPATEQAWREAFENIEDAGIGAFEEILNSVDGLKELNDTMSEFAGIMTGLKTDDPFRELTVSADKFNRTVNSGTDKTLKDAAEFLTEEFDRRANGEEGLLFGDDDVQLQQYAQEVMSAITEDLQTREEAAEELEEKVIDAMEYQSELVEERIEQYDRITSQLEHQQKIVELMHGEDSYDELIQVYDAMAAVNETKLAELKNAERQYQMLADGFEEGSDAHKEAMQLVYDTQEEIDSLVEESIELYQQKFEKMIDATIDKFTKSLTGTDDLEWMQEEWELINRNADQYLDAVNSAYEIQKLQGRYVEILDEATDPGIQREITKQMNEQLKILREKDKLSQYDVEYANAQLEILQKRIALEDAQRNKNQMRLKRDAQGNYSYVYTADENKIAAAQQALADAENNAYNLSKDNIISQQENAMSAISGANSLIRDIMVNASLTEEEKQNRVDTVYESLREYLSGVSEQLSGSEANIIKDYIDAIDSIDPENRGEGLLGDVFGVDKRLDTELKDRLQALEMSTYKESELYSQLMAAEQEWSDKSSEILTKAGDDFESFGENIEGAYESVEDLNKGMKEFFDGLAAQNKQLIENQQQATQYRLDLEGLYEIMDKLYEGAKGGFKDFMDVDVVVNTITGGGSEESPSAFDTGGYTGSWSDGSGKLAMLHSKELVLNAHDTANILKTVDMVREMTNAMKIDAFGMMPGSMLGNVNKTSGNDNDVNVSITAEFPNAYSASEIKTAIMDLNEQAIQHVYKNR